MWVDLGSVWDKGQQANENREGEHLDVWLEPLSKWTPEISFMQLKKASTSYDDLSQHNFKPLNQIPFCGLFLAFPKASNVAFVSISPEKNSKSKEWSL